MSAHADCTHEKTKAARAACRAGKAPATPDLRNTRERLIAKAAKADAKLGEPRDEGAERSSIDSKLYISGHCATGNHERCAGVYAGVNCSCICDHTH